MNTIIKILSAILLFNVFGYANLLELTGFYGYEKLTRNASVFYDNNGKVYAWDTYCYKNYYGFSVRYVINNYIKLGVSYSRLEEV